MSEQIELRSICKTFPEKNHSTTTVLQDISFTAERGEITTILGESGCGKTTLLRIVAGLETADSGRIFRNGEDITSLPSSKRKIAMVFQNYGLYPAKTVRDNIEFPLKISGVNTTERHKESDEISRLLHVDQLLTRFPSQLSGGQCQRVGIARALIRKPEILLMDEPLSNLDPQLRGEMRDDILRIQQETGSTILYVTHDQTEAMSMSHKLIVLRSGHIEQEGTPEQVFFKPATTYVAKFLGNMNLNTIDDETVIGVRAEHFIPMDDNNAKLGDLVVTGAVIHNDLLGTDRILHVRDEHGVWRARVDSNREIPETITLLARKEHVHRFNARTGARYES